MTWQEELSQLDGALASGQISADDYRRERERILAVATGGSQQNPPTPGQGAPVNRGQDAFPPPFKWTTERPAQTPQQQPPQPPPQQGGEERTQAVQNSTSAAEKTQIVSNAADSTQIVDMNDSASKGPGPSFGDRTQFVPQVPASPPHGMPQQSPPHGMPQQQWQQQGPPPQGAWGPPQQQSSPPWEDQEELVPPWAGYQAQGSELFESDAPSGRGKVWAIVGVVVLLLVIAGGVLYLTVLKKDDSATADGGKQQEQTSKKPPPTSQTPEPFGPLYVPEGTTSGGKTYTAANLEKSKALPTPDVVLLKQAGLKEARSVVVVNESTVLSMWSFGTSDPPGLAQDITKDQKRFGFKKVPAESVQGVDVYTSTQKSASRTVYVYRAHYTNGGNVIRVEAFDPDKAKAKAQFEAALKAQLDLTAPE
ncbi:MAG TPA: hypothetical protein VGP26_05385 [Actinophytocola sp.]|nr:hypothetical protein [Actinophytocola sp.]